MNKTSEINSEMTARVSTRFADLVHMGQRASHLSLPTTNIKSYHKGSLLSAFKGRGMELADIRRYQDGDDVRDLNWPMYARTGEIYTKLYQEERERPLYLWVDHSSSMQFATQGSYKAVIASHLAAVIGWHELGNHNRIGGIVVTDHDCHQIKASKNRQGFMRFLQQLCETNNKPNANQTNANQLADKMLSLNSIKQPGAAVYLFSDFRGWNDTCEQQLIRLSQHQDILLTIILDPLELKLPEQGVYAFGNGKEQVSMDMSKKHALADYYQSIESRLARLKHLSHYPNIDCTYVLTNDDPIEASYQSLNQWQDPFKVGGDA